MDVAKSIKIYQGMGTEIVMRSRFTLPFICLFQKNLILIFIKKNSNMKPILSPYLLKCSLCCIYLLSSLLLISQSNTMPLCGGNVQQEKKQSNPQHVQKMMTFEADYQAHMNNITLNTNSNYGTVYTVPVVVHVIHSGQTLGTDANRTDANIKGIIEEASQRFRHNYTNAPTHPNPYSSTDTEIELCLATTDPNGNYTTGITRHYNPTFYTSVALGNGPMVDFLNSIAWDKSKYCNIYLFNITDAGGYYFGQSDIVLMNSGSFWSALTAHEVGHYLALDHTFDGCTNNNCLADGDKVCDTPPKDNQGIPNGFSCSNASNSCSTDQDDTSNNNPYRAGGPQAGNQNDVMENYMDYTITCWTTGAFTEGQKERMRFQITNQRQAMITNNNACQAQTTPANDAAVVNTPGAPQVCGTSVSPNISVQNFGTATITSLKIKASTSAGQTLATTTALTVNIAPGATQSLTFAPAITIAQSNIIIFTIDEVNGTTDGNPSNDSAGGWYLPQHTGYNNCFIDTKCVDLPANSGFYENATLSFTGVPTTMVSGAQAGLTFKLNGSEFTTNASGTINNAQAASSESGSILSTWPIIGGATNCVSTFREKNVTASESDYNSWANDGQVDFNFVATHMGPPPPDCNGNPTVQFCTDIIVPTGGAVSLCNISDISAGTPSACSNNTYSVSVTVTHNNAPGSGQLMVNGQGFTIGTSPQMVTLTGLTADGKSTNISAWFSAAPQCAFTKYSLFTAPAACGGGGNCAITAIATGAQTACNASNNTYTQVVTVTYSDAPASGQLMVNGQGFAIGTSPQMVTLTGLTANGQAVNVTANFSAMTSCTFTQNAAFTAPASCGGSTCNSVALTCNQPYNGNTTSGANNFANYACYDFDHSGKEIIHTITTTSTGNITAALSNLNGVDLDVLILTDCNMASSCIAGNDVSTTASNQAAGTYYIVVEGYQGAEGSYTLTVTANCTNNCNTPPPVSGTIAANTYQVIGDMTSGGQVLSPSNVIFKASNSISLLANFEVKAGATFEAMIATCTPFAPDTETETALEVPEGQQLETTDLSSDGLKIYPNPFKAQTNIRYTLSETSKVSIDVFDINGKRIATLLNNSLQAEGQHQLNFDASNLAEGIYYVHFRTKNTMRTERLVLMK